MYSGRVAGLTFKESLDLIFRERSTLRALKHMRTASWNRYLSQRVAGRTLYHSSPYLVCLESVICACVCMCM